MSTTTGAKRGRKPRGALSVPSLASPRPLSNDPLPTTTTTTTTIPASLPTTVHWTPSQTTTTLNSLFSNVNSSSGATTTTPAQLLASLSSARATASQTVPNVAGTLTTIRPTAVDEDGDGDDELFPAMADDDYSAQLSWQSQSKDNVKVLMDNLTPPQYDRFEAYRRHALPKQAVRKLIQQSLGQQVSQPVSQIVAGIAKVFVGEIVEKARLVQTRRGDVGPLTPDHLREAYRMYHLETGRVGAARPVSSKRLFVK